MSTTNQPNPFAIARAQHVNVGTVDVEGSRAVAEAQGQLVIAKKFPRNAAAAFEQVMASCKRPTLAAQATYSYPKGGQTISGPSIRLAEELARAWGNLSFGIRELSQRDGVSEMQAYCWDLETNVRSEQNFTVKHERHTSQGVKRLTDPRDIYELTANQAGRRLRARILAILPPDLIEAALEECRKTLVGGGSADPQQVAKVVKAFERFGVTAAHIAARLGHPIEAITPDELADLMNIGNSLRDNMSHPGDWFEGLQGGSVANHAGTAAEAVNQKLAGLSRNGHQPSEAAEQPITNPPATFTPAVETSRKRPTAKAAEQPSQLQAPQAGGDQGGEDEDLV